MCDSGLYSSYALGIGLRPACRYDALKSLVAALLAEHGIGAHQLIGLATWTPRAETLAVRALADKLGLSIVTFDLDALADVNARLLSRSPGLQQRLGVDSVAEAAALALFDRWQGAASALLGPRRASSVATAALAGHAPTTGATVSHRLT